MYDYRPNWTPLSPVTITNNIIIIREFCWNLSTNLNPQSFTTGNFSPEYAKYSSDEEDEDDEVLGEPFMKERDVDEQEMDKVLL